MKSYATVKGQIVIPAKIRKKYGIKAGTKIEVIDEGERIVLQPITPAYVRSLRGKYKGTGTSLPERHLRLKRTKELRM